jgi:hypothetical protein
MLALDGIKAVTSLGKLLCHIAPTFSVQYHVEPSLTVHVVLPLMQMMCHGDGDG